jgi:hypothetical protein
MMNGEISDVVKALSDPLAERNHDV